MADAEVDGFDPLVVATAGWQEARLQANASDGGVARPDLRRVGIDADHTVRAGERHLGARSSPVPMAARR